MSTIAETVEQLHKFKTLPQGWNFGEGVPTAPEAVAPSMIIMSIARGLGFTDVEAFPGVNGEVQLCFYENGKVLEFIVEPNGAITVTSESEGEFIREGENLHFSKAVRFLKEFKYTGWHSYVLSTSNTTAVKVASQVWPFAPRTKASPSLMNNVQRYEAKAYARTSGPIIQKQPVRQSYTGKSRLTKSRRTAKPCIA